MLKHFKDISLEINKLILTSNIEVNISISEWRIEKEMIIILSPLEEYILRLSNNYTKLL